MDKIPQPSSEPYTVGDVVRIYLGPDDVDSEYHGTVCAVSDVHTDDLDSKTGRELDAYSYAVQRVGTEDRLSIVFRHQDLVPHDTNG